MLDQITRVLSMRASEKGLCFYCRILDPAPDVVVGDRMRLQQVLLNLAGNAIKFTERGEVEVGLRVLEMKDEEGEKGGKGEREKGRGGERESGTDGDPQTDGGDSKETSLSIPFPLAPFSPSPPLPFSPSPFPPQPQADTRPSPLLEFSVRDTGIGIPPSSREHLFQPFAQADSSMTRRFGGTGLGLAICKNLVEMMGGRIWVESEAGQGSTFRFNVRLPLATEPPADVEAPPVTAAMAGTPLRILLVEDNPANQKLADYILRERGHRVEIAGDGQEAIYLAGEHRYDVILMDVQMPEMDGLEATAVIRSREGGADRVPIVALTAHSMKSDRERCLAAGMDAYLSKPIKREELIETVERLGEKGNCKSQISSLKSEISDLGSQITDCKSQISNCKSQIERPSPTPSPHFPLPDSAPFDIDQAMESLGGEMGLFRQMVRFFFSDGLKLTREIQAAAGSGDARTIETKAHRLKGTVLYLGAEAAIGAVARVEVLGRSGDLADVAPAIGLMETEVARLAEALKPWSQPVGNEVGQERK
jgi:CheY-like chemotaxis protein/HPt (histidine-containing phosphotransfer) domain-containing protein